MKVRSKWRLLLLLLLMYAHATGRAHNTFFVDPLGSDSFPGTTQLTPWRTIQHAMDSALEGSNVFIKGGIYNEKLVVNVSGFKSHAITFLNFEDDNVIIDGTGLPQKAIIEIKNKSYVNIVGLTLINNTVPDAQGIVVEGFCEYIELRDNTISNIHFSDDPNDPVDSTTNSQPLIVYGNVANKAISNLLITGNEIFNCRTGYSEALAVNGNVAAFEVSNNLVHDISNIGIDIIGHEGTSSNPATDQARDGTVSGNEVYNCLSPYATAAGIYIDGAKDIVVERNKVYQNQWGIEVGCESVGDTAARIIVRNNFIYRNQQSALAIGGFDYPVGSGMVVDCKVLNNSCFSNDVLNQWAGELTLGYTENLVVRNNIFYAANANTQLLTLDDQVQAPVNLMIDNNVWFHSLGAANSEFYWNGSSYTGFAAYQSATGQDTNSIFVDPAFESIDLNQPDLHISPASPAYNAPMAAAIADVGPVDYDGEDRMADGSLDIGADEHNFSTFISEVTATMQVEFFPNPASDVVNLLVTGVDLTDLKVTLSSGRGFGKEHYQSIAPEAMMRIDLRAYKPGIYYLTISNRRFSVSRQVVIVR